MHKNKEFANFFQNLEDLSRTETIVGKPINIDNITLIPLIEVALTLRARTSTLGMGTNIVPKCILIIKEDQVYTIELK